MLGAAADSGSRVSLLSAQAGCLLDTDRKYCAGGGRFFCDAAKTFLGAR